MVDQPWHQHASSGQTKAPLPPMARVASVQDESGATTLYRVEYDRVRQQYTITSQDPTGASRRRVYNKAGLLLQNSTNDQVQSQCIVDSANQERSIAIRGAWPRSPCPIKAASATWITSWMQPTRIKILGAAKTRAAQTFILSKHDSCKAMPTTTLPQGDNSAQDFPYPIGPDIPHSTRRP